MTSPVPPCRRPGRRAVLLGGVLALGGAVSACGRDAAGPASGSRTTSPPVPRAPATPADTSPPPPPAPPAPLPDLPAYAVLAGEVEPACKQAAVDYVAAVLTAGTVASTPRPLDARLGAIGQPVAPSAALLDMVPTAGASTLEVVYPQYGGLVPTRDEASVMLVADQLVTLQGAGGAPPLVERRSLTVDVRLAASGGAWTVTQLLPAALPVPAPAASATALSVLEAPRVVLPAAARADLLGGGVHDAVAGALLQLSERWQVHVQVLVSGHPYHVFATDKVSHHTRGKAVDIWALDGVPVIDQGRCAWREALHAGALAGATEVGGPSAVGVRGAFTDQVHQDHLHLGFGRA